jgi:hypothetical protein
VAVECQPVQPTKQSQRQRQPAGIVFVSGQDGGEDTTGRYIGGHPIQHVAVHRRAQPRADLALQSKRPQQAAFAG